MLSSLTPSDIQAIIAACASNEPAPDAPADDVQVSAARNRVYGLVEHLSREAQEELLAVMWTGGPNNENSFAENLELAHKTWDENHASHIAEQHAMLPNYLGDGLRRMSAEKD